MNFDDGQVSQRPIVGSSDSIEQKISSPTPRALEGSDHQSSRRRASIDSRGSAGTIDSSNDGFVDTIFDADVLCGRGKTSFNHAGNKRFRDLVTAATPDYDKADSRLEKSLVVHSVLESVRTAGGRFLKAHQASGKWRELNDRACREKVGHAIRDAAAIAQATLRKKRLKAQNSMSSSTMIMPSRGPISRYSEMKSSDTPEPVSFHDMARLSNVMRPGLPHDMGLDSRIPGLAEGMQHAEPGSFQPSFVPPPYIGLGQANANANARGADQDEHPPDEAGFLAHIDAVLGPMPANHDKDPLAEILELT